MPAQTGRESHPVLFDPRTPREYQRVAVDRWHAANGRGSVVLPTGAGKSFVAVVAIHETGARACVVAPTRALVAQWYGQLADAFGADRVGAWYGEKLGVQRAGWTLTREDSPVTTGETLMLPDFTACHRDGREALIEIVGFWTPAYLEEKLRKLHLARGRLSNLVLVVYRGLASGDDGRKAEAGLATATDAPIVWFENKPRIGPVMEAVERVAQTAPMSRTSQRASQ